MYVISTRTESSKVIQEFKQAGIQLSSVPVRTYSWVTPAPHQKEIISRPVPWVFTSKKGVEGWFRYHKEHLSQEAPVQFAIGPSTAEACRQYFKNVPLRVSEEAYGGSLGTLLQQSKVTEAIHFCGCKRRKELKELCVSSGILLHEIEVYCGKRVEKKKEIDVAPDAVLFFSPEGVLDFKILYGTLPGNWQAIAIGKTTSEAIKQVFSKDACIPEVPRVEEMISLIK
ncbi:uroporphyrinogen-III synthase [Balneolaceae bacterium ANBcel3]|nr:uroporphyrinogen-III synthase [Balneolaceae bacterium ANBcel3]